MCYFKQVVINKQHMNSVSWWIFSFFKSSSLETFPKPSLRLRQSCSFTRRRDVKTIKAAILQSLFLRYLFLSVSLFLHRINRLTRSQFSSYPLLHYLSLTPHTPPCIPSRTHSHTHTKDYTQGRRSVKEKGDLQVIVRR